MWATLVYEKGTKKVVIITLDHDFRTARGNAELRNAESIKYQFVVKCASELTGKQIEWIRRNNITCRCDNKCCNPNALTYKL